MDTVSNQALVTARCNELAALITRRTDGKGNGIHTTAIAQLGFMRDSSCTAICSVYEPALVIVVQGKKEMLLGEEIYSYGTAQYLVVSVSLPVRVLIVEASSEQPYLCFLLKLSALHLCNIVAQVQPNKIKSEDSARGLFVGSIDIPLIDCAIRLTRLLDTPQHIAFVAPMIIREIYYYLLAGEQGEAVRQLATSGSDTQRVAEAIDLIKADFAKLLRVEELAE